MNAGREVDGEHGGRPPVAVLARPVPTIPLGTTVAEAVDARGGAPFLLVVNDRGIVLGKVLARSLESPSDDPVDTVLIEGPTTVRAGEPLPELLERMDRAATASVVVTSNQGELLGVLFADDARRAVEEQRRAHHHHHHER